MGHLRKIVLWCLFISICVSLIGCHTVRGVGEDMEAAGEAVQRATQ